MLRDASGKLVMTKGWKAFFIIMAIILVSAIIVLSVLLGISKAQEEKWMANSEYNYENAYYTLTDSLLNMENGLSKVRVARSESLVNEVVI
ncbi:MAG: hypothetical protein K2J13_05435, partial [Clostridia bacterium]|nr:hypothetical protein [Clostridia bacterium]